MEQQLQITCPNEINFTEMFSVLGNVHAQQVIRNLHPEPKGAKEKIHCDYLKKNPNACNDRALSGGVRGICPSNPYHPENSIKREILRKNFLKQHRFLISKHVSDFLDSRGLYLATCIQSGFIRSVSDLSPMDFTLGTITAEHNRQEAEIKKMELLSTMIASKIYGVKWKV